MRAASSTWRRRSASRSAPTTSRSAPPRATGEHARPRRCCHHMWSGHAALARTIRSSNHALTIASRPGFHFDRGLRPQAGLFRPRADAARCEGPRATTESVGTKAGSTLTRHPHDLSSRASSSTSSGPYRSGRRAGQTERGSRRRLLEPYRPPKTRSTMQCSRPWLASAEPAGAESPGLRGTCGPPGSGLRLSDPDLPPANTGCWRRSAQGRRDRRPESVDAERAF